MSFVFSSIFWGLLIILFGISIIIKAVFKIDIPIFRMVFALLLIYWGVKLMFGDVFSKKTEGTVVFNEAKFDASSKNNEYNVIFGRSDVDLRNIDLSQGNVRAEINIVFGSGTVYLSPEIPAIIKVETVFGDSSLPGKSTSILGDTIYRTPTFKQDEPHLQLQISVVFGSGRIIL
jgi:predicted membrane protein